MLYDGLTATITRVIGTWSESPEMSGFIVNARVWDRGIGHVRIQRVGREWVGYSCSVEPMPKPLLHEAAEALYRKKQARAVK